MKAQDCRTVLAQQQINVTKTTSFLWPLQFLVFKESCSCNLRILLLMSFVKETQYFWNNRKTKKKRKKGFGNQYSRISMIKPTVTFKTLILFLMKSKLVGTSWPYLFIHFTSGIFLKPHWSPPFGIIYTVSYTLLWAVWRPLRTANILILKT